MNLYRIAAATTDGQKINQHFGSASQIIIYQADESSYGVEKILVFDGNGACTGNHDDALARLEAVTDCQYIIAARIGSKIQRYFEFNKQKFFEMPGHDIEYVLSRIVQYHAGTARRRER